MNNEISIGKNVFKIRIASSDINKVKSAGFRSYFYLYLKKDLLVPVCIYSKSKMESITENELKYHMDITTKEIFENIL